jgi:hypothetical protein
MEASSEGSTVGGILGLRTSEDAGWRLSPQRLAGPEDSSLKSGYKQTFQEPGGGILGLRASEDAGWRLSPQRLAAPTILL